MSANSVEPPAPLLTSTPSALKEKFKLFLLDVSQERLWFWGLRSGYSLLDQGLVSGSSFFLNIVLARWLIKDAYGSFAVCFASLLFLSGFHNVLLVEPMTVIGPSCYSDHLIEYFGSQLRVHMIIVVPLSVIVFTVGALLRFGAESLSRPVLSLGIALPFVLLLYLVRRMCYAVQNPLIAVQASGLYCFVLLAGVFYLGHLRDLTPSTSFLLMGAASLLPALFVLWRLGFHYYVILGDFSSSLSGTLLENWDYGKWLVLTTMFSWLLVQAQTFFAAFFLELSAAGVLRAMQIPSFFMSQLIAATMLLFLPSISVELGRGNISRLHKKTLLVAAVLLASGLMFVSLLYIFAVPIEQMLFHGKYASTAWLIPVLGLAPLFSGIAASLSLALRTLRKAKFELLSYVASATTAVLLAVSLMPHWGLTGAAISIVGGTATLALGVIFCYVKWGLNRQCAPREQ
ncbi:MAG TPA: lipopolysaccharide biosynthesis protein [Terriglobales bacterium]|jgi:O-antigen/teichoic acid export membrane protein